MHAPIFDKVIVVEDQRDLVIDGGQLAEQGGQHQLSEVGTPLGELERTRRHPGLALPSAAITQDQNREGSLSDESRDSQPRRRRSSAPLAHCAKSVVLPQPAGALSNVSLREGSAERISISARRSMS